MPVHVLVVHPDPKTIAVQQTIHYSGDPDPYITVRTFDTATTFTHEQWRIVKELVHLTDMAATHDHASGYPNALHALLSHFRPEGLQSPS